MPPTPKSLHTLLIKPAGPDCNLACDYCFYAARSALFPAPGAHRMTDEVLALLIKQALSQTERQVAFGWQGGEPTLCGLPFFERALELQERHHRGQLIGNGLQTNGLLLDSAWARFLARGKFLVGLSLDGPEHVHDRYRKLASGRGSWAVVRDRASLLLDRGVEVNALVVVNDYSVEFPDEIYDFHRQLGLVHMQFIPAIGIGPEPVDTARFFPPAEALGRFWARLFDRWLEDFKDGVPATFIRFFDAVFHRYVGLEPPECSLGEECGDYLVVEHTGDVYACDFYVEPAWRLGRIQDDRLIDLLNSPDQLCFGRQKSALADRCRACPRLSLCRAACPRERPAPNLPSRYCRAYQIFFDHAHSRLTALAADWRRSQPANVAPVSNRRPQTGRNDPCPCGSGRKFKKCCGASPK
jgi:uncharacterized protein